MPPEDEKTPLERLEERLYQRKDTETAEVPAYSNQVPAERYGWAPPPPPLPKKPHMSWTARFLIGTGIFFVLAGGTAAFLVLYGSRTVSSDHIQITALPHPPIASGDSVPIVITIHNGNPTAIKDANIYATLPPGTRKSDGTDAPFEQYTDTLGTLGPGADATRTIQAKLFGTEDQVLTIPIRVEYRVDGSNARFVAQEEYSITVSTSPIDIQVSTLSESASGQPLTVSAVVRSNAAVPIKDLAVSVESPFGFVLSSATPTPVSGSFFSLGDLAPGEEKTIKLTGTLTGQNADERVFRFTAGLRNPDGTSTLGLTYAEDAAAVTLTRPFLAVSLSLNREVADTIVVSPEESLSALLSWENSLTVPITDANIRVALSGNALDAASVSGGTGFYRSTDSSVIFSKETTAGLSVLQAGDNGAGTFSFAAKPAGELTGVRNPTITLTVSASGKRTQQGNVPETLTSTVTRTVKVGTTIDLKSSLARVSGPLPPTAGTETVYTVNLTAKNSLNSVGGARVTTTLPTYVRFVASASGSNVTYDEGSRIVTWNAADLQPGGAGSASFQAALLPSASQSGTSPIVVGEQVFTGIDRFTQAQVKASSPALTSELAGDRSSGIVR